jgi:hypothetical protein
MPEKCYILYDARARTDHPSTATVLDTADTEREARRISADNRRTGWMTDAIWIEYDVVPFGGRDMLANQRLRPDLSHPRRRRVT